MPTSKDAATVSAAEISRSFGEWQSKALARRVFITHHRKARLVLMSVEELQALEKTSGATQTSDEAVRLSARFCGVLNQIDEGFCSLDVNLNVTDLNRVAEGYLGFAKADLIGRSLKESIPSLKHSLLWSHFKNLVRTGTSFNFSYRSILYPGSTVHMRAFPYDGGVGVLFRTETIQETSYQVWWSALEAAVCTDPTRAILRLNVRGGISIAHKNFCDMTGFATEKLETLLLTEIAHPHERLRLAKAINGALHACSSKPEVYTFLMHDGGERRLRLTMGAASELPMPDGLVILVVDVDAQSAAR